MPEPVIHPVGPADHSDLLELNQANVPALGKLDPASLAALLEHCALALAARSPDGALAGMLLALEQGSDYQSPNYRYFAANHSAFLYIDRVAVAPAARGLGLGRGLYRAAEEHASARRLRLLCCEVNVRPPNPGSMAFHQRLGFAEVGRQPTESGNKEVALLEKRFRP